MTPRVFVVGTDTSVGKTSLVCALLSLARTHGRVVLPYKPAQSNSPDERSDGDRLLAAAAIDGLDTTDIVGFSGARPIAPGMIDDAAAFLDAPRVDEGPIVHARTHLERAIDRVRPHLAIVEGAGGLWVPMPGGTWQPQWIRALATHVVIVARANLGTINHTLCTIDALRALDLAPLGFYTSETFAPDAASPTNARVIERARELPHLGTLPFERVPNADLLAPLLDRLA